MSARWPQLAVALVAVLRASIALGCPGDCDGNGRITIDELVLGVVIHRGGARLNSCPNFDTDGGGVSVSEVVESTQVALEGCPFLGEFHAVVDLAGGQTGSLEMTVMADGDAAGTLTITDAVGSGGAAAIPSISLSGSVNLATGEFSISGSYSDGEQTIPISISGTLPAPLGSGSINFQIGPNSFPGTIQPGPVPAPSPTPTPTNTPSGAVHVVVVGKAGEQTIFTPEFLAIPIGDTVEWRWDSGPHSVRSGAIVGGFPSCNPDGLFDSGVLSSGTFSHTFNTAGDFGYHCAVAGHCENFESAIIQVIGPSPTVTPTPTRTPVPPTPTATFAIIDGVSVDMIGTFSGTATAQSTQFMFPARIRIDAGSGSVTATDLLSTLFTPNNTLTMTVIDPTHLSYHATGPPEVSVTLTLTSPNHVEGVFMVIMFMPSTPVLIDLTKEP